MPLAEWAAGSTHSETWEYWFLHVRWSAQSATHDTKGSINLNSSKTSGSRCVGIATFSLFPYDPCSLQWFWWRWEVIMYQSLSSLFSVHWPFSLSAPQFLSEAAVLGSMFWSVGRTLNWWPLHDWLYEVFRKDMRRWGRPEVPERTSYTLWE